MKIAQSGPQNVGQVKTYFEFGNLFLSSEEYQREGVWKPDQKRLLVDTIFRGMDIPKLYFWKIDQRTLTNGYPDGETKGLYETILERKRKENDDPDPHIFEVVDGQQRIRTILEYMGVNPPRNEVYRGTWHPPFTALEETPMDRGRGFSQLNPEQVNKFEQGSLTIMVLEDASIDEIRDMFLRLQNGTPLNAQQKRDAEGSNVGKIAIELSGLPFLAERVNFGNSDAAHHSVAAQMLNLELKGKAVSCDSRQLDKLYKQYKSVGVDPEVVAKARRVIKILGNIFETKHPRLNRSYALSLYWALSCVLKTHKTPTGGYPAIRKNFETLDHRRLLARDRDYSEGSDEVYEDLSRSMSRGTDGLDGISTRHGIMSRFLFDNVQLKEKPTLDPRRAYSIEEKLILYGRADGKCQLGHNREVCGRPIEFEDAVVDHVVPYSKGGSTTLENGRISHERCNKARGNREEFDPQTMCAFLEEENTKS